MPARRLRLAVVLALICALLASVSAPADAASREMRRLRQTRAQIAEVQRQIGQTKAQAAQQQASLQAAQRQVNAILNAVGAAEEAVARQEAAVEAARQRLEDLRAEEARRRAVLRSRTLRLYKQGSGVPFAPMLSASSPADALRRSAYVDIVNRTDRREVEGASIAQVAVEAQRKELAAREAELERMLGEQRQLLAQVQTIRDSRAASLAGVSQKLKQLQAQERHLAGESQKIAALSRRSTSRVSRSDVVDVPGIAKTGWAWPARGPVTSEYGRRWGRQHEGIDIGAATGAPIFAARAGVVSFVGQMSGYGNLTLVDHGGGIVTAYAHQSRFGVRRGQQVAAGERIGSIGCTGNCTGPHLHFEVRVNGSPRNPRRYLP